MAQIEGATKLIADRGGPKVVSDALGWPYSTVHHFFRTDTVPDYRLAALKALPKRKASAIRIKAGAPRPQPNEAA